VAKNQSKPKKNDTHIRKQTRAFLMMVGQITLIIGPMFASKTSTLMSYIEKYQKIGKSVLVVKHSDDTRYGDDDYLYTHDNKKQRCCRTQDLADLFFDDITSVDAVFIDEAQFFPSLADTCQTLCEKMGKHVFVSALDGDYKRHIFPEIAKLVAMCDRIVKLKSMCAACGDGTEALFSYKINSTLKPLTSSSKDIGSSEKYLPLCRKHFVEFSLSAPQNT
jgi:thymidine kinase